MITLEMIDQVRERTGASYKDAKDALETVNGDVVEAVILLESQSQKSLSDNVTEMGNELVEALKDIIKKGNVTRITLEKDNKVALDIPIVAGVLGAFFFSAASVSAILAALAVGYTLKIVKDDGDIIDIKDVAEDTIQNVKSKVEEIKTRLAKSAEEDEEKEEIEVEIKEAEEDESDKDQY